MPQVIEMLSAACVACVSSLTDVFVVKLVIIAVKANDIIGHSRYITWTATSSGTDEAV